MFPAEVQPIVSAIVGGSPFARSLSPLPTSRTAVSFPLVNDVDDPQWLAELGVIPTLNIDAAEDVIAVSKLAGSVLISLESIRDTDYPVTQQTEQVLQDTFSAKLDADFIGGSGVAPIPAGILSVAAEVTGADWLAAAIAAKAQIATAGGTANLIALDPATLGAIEDERDTQGHQLYPDAATMFAGMETITAVSASAPIVYDSSRLWLAINRDFTAEFSDQTDAAWSRYATSLRIVGRFACCAPMPAKSVRKLALTAPLAERRAK
jgi:HK97 family phage major capsid protein